MALTLSIGRGLMRAAYDPETVPSLEQVLSKLKSDFVTMYGDLDLSTDSLSDFSTFIAAAVEAAGQGDFETYAPYKGSMVRVFVDQQSSNVITWCWGAELYALTADGLIHQGLVALKEYNQAVIATID